MAVNILQIALQKAPVNGANEVVELSITGTATGGTFTLTFGGQTTGDVSFDAAASDVQTALIALSNIASGDVVCTGGPLPGTPIVITFGGAYAGVNVGDVTSTDSLTGSTPATVLTVTTQGVAGSYRGIVTGAMLIDEVNGDIYYNTGSPSVPTWTKATP